MLTLVAFVLTNAGVSYAISQPKTSQLRQIEAKEADRDTPAAIVAALGAPTNPESILNPGVLRDFKKTDDQINKLRRKFPGLEFMAAVNSPTLKSKIEEISRNNQPIGKEQMCDLQRIIVEYKKDIKVKGDYRNTEVYIRTTSRRIKKVEETPPHKDVPRLMQEFFDWLNSENTKKLHPLEVAARILLAVGSIHPFEDGNGRTAWALMNVWLLREGYPYIEFKGSEGASQPDDPWYNYFEAFVNGNISQLGELINFMIVTELYATERNFVTDATQAAASGDNMLNELDNILSSGFILLDSKESYAGIDHKRQELLETGQLVKQDITKFNTTRDEGLTRLHKTIERIALRQDQMIEPEDIRDLHNSLPEVTKITAPHIYRITDINPKETSSAREKEFLPSTDVPGAMDKLLSWLNSENARKLHPVDVAIRAIYAINSIYPFEHNNSFLALSLANIILIRGGYAPIEPIGPANTRYSADYSYLYRMYFLRSNIPELAKLVIDCESQELSIVRSAIFSNAPIHPLGIMPPVSPKSLIEKGVAALDPDITSVDAQLIVPPKITTKKAPYWSAGAGPAYTTLVTLAAYNSGVREMFSLIGAAEGLGHDETIAVKVGLDNAANKGTERIMSKSSVSIKPAGVEGEDADERGVQTFERRLIGVGDQEKQVEGIFDVLCGTKEAAKGKPGSLSVGVLSSKVSSLPDQRGIGIFFRANMDADPKIELGDLKKLNKTFEEQMIDNFQRIADAMNKPLNELKVAMWDGIPGYKKLIEEMETAGIEVMKLPGAVESYATLRMLTLKEDDPDRPDVVIGIGFPEIQAASALCLLAPGGVPGKGYFSAVSRGETNKDSTVEKIDVFGLSGDEVKKLDRYGMKPIMYEHSWAFSSDDLFYVHTGVTGADESPAARLEGDILTTVSVVVDPSGAVWRVTIKTDLAENVKPLKELPKVRSTVPVPTPIAIVLTADADDKISEFKREITAARSWLNKIPDAKRKNAFMELLNFFEQNVPALLGLYARHIVLIVNTEHDFYGINSDLFDKYPMVARLRGLMQAGIDAKALHGILEDVKINCARATGVNGMVINLSAVNTGIGINASRVKVQGTDGWRGPVNMKPPDADLKVISPENFREYTFAAVTQTRVWLEGIGELKDNEQMIVVVGYDPRDPERIFTNAIIEGAQLAGAKVIDIGISPTPLAAAMMVYYGAHLAIMETASHNPGRTPTDQFGENGIKLFAGGELALKYYPEEDYALTAAYYSVHGRDLEKLSNERGLIRTQGSASDVIDGHKDAEKVLQSMLSDSRNTLFSVELGSSAGAKTPEVIAVVDCGKGAVSGKIRPGDSQDPMDAETFGPVANALHELGITVYEYPQTKDSGDGFVNYKSGAGFIESLQDKSIIKPSAIEEGGVLNGFTSIEQAFRLGRENAEAIKKGSKRVHAVLIDADGDRLIIGTYDPFNDYIIISSGDEILYHQAKYLEEKSQWRGGRLRGAKVCFTIESDSAALRRWLEEYDYDVSMTLVGDKWILFVAIRESLAVRLALIEEKLTPEQRDDFSYEVAGIKQDLHSLGWGESKEVNVRVSALSLMRINKRIKDLARTAGIKDAGLYSDMWVPGKAGFLMGDEETGHLIAPSVIRTKKGEEALIFSGNASVNAVRQVCVDRALYPDTGERNAEQYYNSLRDAFGHGYKGNGYVPNTKRELFSRGSKAFNRINNTLLKIIVRCAWAMHGMYLEKKEEVLTGDELDNTLCLVIWEHAPGGDKSRIIGMLYVRNSGTSPKTSVLMRGLATDTRTKGVLQDILDRAVLAVALELKDRNKVEVITEEAVLLTLDDARREEKTLKIEELQQKAIARLARTHPDIKTGNGFSRMVSAAIFNLRISQRFIATSKGVASLTETGADYVKAIQGKAEADAVGANAARIRDKVIKQINIRRLIERGVIIDGEDFTITPESVDKIGAGTTIYSGARIDLGPEGSIGKGCHISAPVKNCRIGDNNTIKAPVEGIVWAGDGNYIAAKIEGEGNWIGDNCRLEAGVITNSTIGDGCVVKGGATTITNSVLLPYSGRVSKIRNSECAGSVMFGSDIGPFAHVRGDTAGIFANVHAESETVRSILGGAGITSTVDLPHRNYLHGIAQAVSTDTEYNYENPEAYHQELRSKYNILLNGTVTKAEQENAEEAAKYGLKEGVQPAMIYTVSYKGKTYRIRAATVNFGALATTSNFKPQELMGGAKFMSIIEAGAKLGVGAVMQAPVVVSEGTLVGSGAIASGYETPRSSIIMPTSASPETPGKPKVLAGYLETNEGRLTDHVKETVAISMRTMREIEDFAVIYSGLLDSGYGLHKLGVVKWLEVMENLAKDVTYWNTRYLNGVDRSVDLIGEDLKAPDISEAGKAKLQHRLDEQKAVQAQKEALIQQMADITGRISELASQAKEKASPEIVISELQRAKDVTLAQAVKDKLGAVELAAAIIESDAGARLMIKNEVSGHWRFDRILDVASAAELKDLLQRPEYRNVKIILIINNNTDEVFHSENIYENLPHLEISGESANAPEKINSAIRAWLESV